MHLGIDPGWASCGISVIEYETVVVSYNFVPRDYTTEDQIEPVIRELQTTLSERNDVELSSITDAYIERYVAYKGIHSDMSEKILMFIGALRYWLEHRDIAVHMVRAIDWKPTVCKYLVRTQGFNNPYPSFDKKFSLAAAKALSGLDLKTDHEADAICLSYLKEIEDYNNRKTK